VARRLDLAALDAMADAFDRAAAATADVDGFCSSSAWVLPAATALMPPGQPVILRDGEAFAAFIARRHDDRVALEPLELAWGLACPLVGPSPLALATLAAEGIEQAAVDLAVIAGVVDGSPLFAALVRRLAGRRLLRGPVTRRHLASLAGGEDGFLARRSRDLRKALRRAAARAAAAGVEFVHHRPATAAEAGALYDRALAVEARSWKGQAGTGLLEPGMAAFYRAMLARLALRGAARVTLIRRAGQDVGFVLGARWDGLYRGLQFSVDVAERALGLGNLAQLAVVRELCAEGVTTYDLGTGGEYKARWAEGSLDTVSLVVAG
jgi:hypothetical protein